MIPVLANLAFPAQLWPELTNFGLWSAGLVIVLIELAVVKGCNPAAPWLRLIAAVTLANIFSSIAGFVISSYLVPGLLADLQFGPALFQTRDALAFARPFVVLAALNTILEGFFYVTLNQVYPLDRPWLGAIAANTVTAGILAGVLLVQF